MSGSIVRGFAYAGLLAALITRHGRYALLGLVVVFLPIVVVWKTIEHAHKLTSDAVSTVAPEVEVVGGVTIATVIFVAILVAAWFLGRWVKGTEWGQGLLAWEKAKLVSHSPLVTKYSKKKAKKTAGATGPEVSPEAQPALACIAGAWQPGVIVEEPSGGWSTVFVPEIPALSSGRLYCLSAEQVLRLEIPLPEFRKKLTATGSGSGDWLAALSDASRPSPPPAGAAPREG